MSTVYHIEGELFATLDDAMAWRKSKNYTNLPDSAVLNCSFLQCCELFATLMDDSDESGLSVIDCFNIAANGPC